MSAERAHHATGTILFSAALASLLGSGDAAAQFTMAREATVDTVQIGERVRVSVPSTFRQSVFGSRTERFRGTVRGVTRDTLYLELPNVAGTARVPRASIRRVEVSVGPSPYGAALRAGTVGAVILGLRMWVVNEDPRTRRFREAWQAVGVGAAIGFGLGASLGSRWPSERWRVARLPD